MRGAAQQSQAQQPPTRVDEHPGDDLASAKVGRNRQPGSHPGGDDRGGDDRRRVLSLRPLADLARQYRAHEHAGREVADPQVQDVIGRGPLERRVQQRDPGPLEARRGEQREGALS